MLLPALALLAIPIGVGARRLPDRAQIERAVDAWFACTADMDCRGLRPFHRRLTSSHCHRLGPEEPQPGRILCVFSGYNIGGNRRAPERFRNDCVYMIPARRGWQVSSIPDADLCGD